MNILFLYIKVTVVTSIIYLTLDHLWFTLFAKKLYFKYLSYLSETADEKIIYKKQYIIASRIIIASAITAAIFISMYVGPKINWAVAGGAFAAFAIYSFYNITCLSYIKKWPFYISILDVAWGTLQGMLAGIYVFFLTSIL